MSLFTIGLMQADAEAWMERARGLLTAYGPGVLQAAVTFLVGWWVAKIFRRVLRTILTKREVDRTLTSFLSSVTYFAIMIMVVIAVVDKLGVKTTSFVAVLGAAGLAIGFALQGSLANFAAGVMIIVLRPFRSGDFVEVAGISGVVLDVQIFATTLKTGDNKKIIVPNGSIRAASTWSSGSATTTTSRRRSRSCRRSWSRTSGCSRIRLRSSRCRSWGIPA